MMPKLKKFQSSSSIRKPVVGKSRSHISTSSGSDSDSSSASSSSSCSSDTPSPKIPVKVVDDKSSKTKSTTPPPEIKAKDDMKNNEAESARMETAKATTTTTVNVNGIGDEPSTKYKNHPEHVAVLDKLSTGLKEEVKRGLQLLNSCVNQLAQVKWILVNVETTLDDSYKECPVCQFKSVRINTSTNPGGSTSNEKDKEDSPHSNSQNLEKQDIQEIPEQNDSDRESKKSHISQPIIMPMGRSGLNFSKHTTKYKQKLDKLPVKTPAPSKSKPIETSPVTSKSHTSDIHHSKKSETTKVASQPKKYKAGPRSKTRPLEKPLDKSPSESDENVEEIPAFPPGGSTLIMNASQFKFFEELLKKGSSVNVGLEDISSRLDGRKYIKDWRDLAPDPETKELHHKSKASTSVKSEPKADSSDLDEDVALIKLKRKNVDDKEKCSKKHKSSSNSHSRPHHSKEKEKHSSGKDSSKDKDRRSKTKDESVRKDRKSIDSHTSEKERKNSTESSKHRKSTDSSEHRSKKTSSKTTSAHKSKDSKSERTGHDSKRRKVDDSDDKKSLASSTHGSESSKRNPTPQVSDSVVKSSSAAAVAAATPNLAESVSTIMPNSSKVQEPTSSKPEVIKKKPGPASKTSKPAVLDMMALAKNADLANLLKQKFQKFQSNKLPAAKIETPVPVAIVPPPSKPEIVEDSQTAAPAASTETQKEKQPASPSDSSGSGASTSEIVKPAETTMPEVTVTRSGSDNLNINEAEPMAPRSDKEDDVENSTDIDNEKNIEAYARRTDDDGAPIPPVADEEPLITSSSLNPHQDDPEPEDSIEIKNHVFDELLQMINSEK